MRIDLPVALGGPSVSACPDYYPAFDYLHVGELGDATDDLIARLARDTSRPRAAGRAQDRGPRRHDATFRSRPMSSPSSSTISSAASSFPAAVPISASSATFPASMAATRASSRRSRSSPSSTRLRECGITGTVYFVDDNFIGNRKAALDLLPHLIEWQKKTGYVTAARLRGDAQHRQAPRDPGDDARGLLRHHLLRHRDAGSRSAEGDAQGPQHDGPASWRACRPSIPTAWRWSPASSWASTPTSPDTGDALLNFIEDSQDSAADHQSAAGAAEDAAVGPAGARGPADRRRGPRFQRRFPAAL